MLRKNRLVLAVTAAAMLWASAAIEAQVSYQTYVIRPAINNDPILADEPLPVQCRDETVMKIMCARGEYEPASFLVKTAQPLKQVMVTVSPLKGAAGTLAAETVDVRVAQKFYQAVTWTSEAFPWVLVHDPGMWKIVDHTPKYYRELDGETHNGHPMAEYKAGFSKINKLVKELIDTDTLQPGDVEDFQQFWLTVHIPQDAKSGTYRSEVTITATNAEPTTLTLEVTVPTFDLLPPQFEYSAYYPTFLEGPDTTDAQREKYHPITEEQYLAEARNMVQHGLTNPCLYYGPEQDEAGTIHFTQLSRILDLREKAGMPKGVVLYLMDGAGMTLKEGELTESQKQRNMEVAKATVAWTKSRGYSGALFMGADEYSGEKLRAMNESYASIRAGGSGIWVANFGDFVEMSPDLELPILAHPGALMVDRHQQWQVSARDYLMNRARLLKWDAGMWLMPHYQRSIKFAHERGNKVFSYFDPQGGQQVPEQHRRHRGMGMWKSGLDGTMTWAYVHIWTPTARLNNPAVQEYGVGSGQNAFVVRGPKGVLDKLSWEGYREGYDDARYLATLQDAMAKAKAAGKHAELVARTQRWLDNLSVHADLDEWRAEMARRIETLLN